MSRARAFKKPAPANWIPKPGETVMLPRWTTYRLIGKVRIVVPPFVKILSEHTTGFIRRTLRIADIRPLPKRRTKKKIEGE